MKIIITILISLIAFTSEGQHYISGNFTPATDYKWLIAYELTPGSQRYIADTAIKEGYFKMELPENAVIGMYRLVYAVPQDEFYIDVIYNGKEDIEFNYSLDEGMHVVASAENMIYNDYLEEISPLEQQLLNFYTAGNMTKKKFKELTTRLSETQKRYEAKSVDLLVYQLIKANAPYVPNNYEDLDTYSNTKKGRYFDGIDFNSRLVQSSGFLKEKLSNYVFTALPLNLKTKEAMQSAMLENVALVCEKLLNTPVPVKTAAFYELWKTANTNTLYTVSDAIFDFYLKESATKNGNQALIDEIELLSRLRTGALSPEIRWINGGATKTLSGLQGAEHYVLVFWSSTCSHCLKELPVLHSALTKYENVKVVAVGLEDDDTYWKQEKGNLPNFEHAIAIGKWESEYAQLFGIEQTPTYFILDKDKHFVANPENDKEVVAFLNKK